MVPLILQVSTDIYVWLPIFNFWIDTASCQAFAKHIPNACRSIDDGEDLFTVWMPFWADDVSGARSKQYQKHINVYTTNANLPGQLLQQEYFVRFVSTSPNAGALEQLKVVTEQVKFVLSTIIIYETNLPEDLRTYSLFAATMPKPVDLVGSVFLFPTAPPTIRNKRKRLPISGTKAIVFAVSVKSEVPRRRKNLPRVTTPFMKYGSCFDRRFCLLIFVAGRSSPTRRRNQILCSRAVTAGNPGCSISCRSFANEYGHKG